MDLLILFKIIGFVAAFYFLVKGGDILVDAASQLAAKFGVSDFIIGLTVIAIGTSAPEFAVSFTAALQGSDSITIGNIIGSNNFNTGWILALTLLLKPIRIGYQVLKKEVLYLIFGFFLLLLFTWSDFEVTQGEGMVLFAGLVFFLGWSFTKQQHSFVAEVPLSEVDPVALPSTTLLGLKVFGGLLMILVASKVLVDIAVEFAFWMGASEWFVAVTILALGTSLPELITSLSSLKHSKEDIGIGNLFGSDIFNLFGVIGSCALIQTLSLQWENFVSIVLAFAALWIFFLLARSSPGIFSNKKAWIILLFALGRSLYEISVVLDF